MVSAGRKVNTVSQEWGTPEKYVSAVRKFFGGHIDLDPCSNEFSIVHAGTEYRLPEHDGLRETWDFPTIYVNPPYGIDKEHGTSIKNWLRQCAMAHRGFGSEVPGACSRCNQHRPLEELCIRPSHGYLLPLRYTPEISRKRPRWRKRGTDVLRRGLLGERSRRILLGVLQVWRSCGYPTPQGQEDRPRYRRQTTAPPGP